MREPIRDKNRLEHILQAIDRLQTHAGNLSKEELEEDVLAQLQKSVDRCQPTTQRFLLP